MGYFDSCCLPPACSQPFIVTGVNKTITVLDEPTLLGLTSGELQIGDDVIIIRPTSMTLAYGVVKFINASATGWAQFAILGNAIAGAISPEGFSAFVLSLPTAPPPAGGPWNNGGVPTQS